jgi:hypothetical protein
LLFLYSAKPAVGVSVENSSAIAAAVLKPLGSIITGSFHRIAFCGRTIRATYSPCTDKM